MSAPLIQVDPYDPWITTITLNRPEKRNALSLQLIQELRDWFDCASGDGQRRVLILRGNGPAFCAGLDLHEAQGPDAHRSAEALAGLYLAIWKCPLATIAAVHGAAMGGGAGLVAACDLAVAADDLKLAYPEVRRGLVAALVTCLLRRQLSDRAIRELILPGQTLSAAEAHRFGLITQISPAADLTASANALAREVCRAAPGAVVRTKRLLEELSPRPIEADIRVALRYHTEARNSPEAAEGVAAFLEKREPNWPPRAS